MANKKETTVMLTSRRKSERVTEVKIHEGSESNVSHNTQCYSVSRCLSRVVWDLPSVSPGSFSLWFLCHHKGTSDYMTGDWL